MADDNTPKNADFIGRVVSDAKNPPETCLLSGWLGDAAEEGFRRLYTDAALSAYVDIPADAILHSEPIRDVQPSGGVFVWVKRDAALKYGGSASSRAARFLQGSVEQEFASGGGGLDPEKAGFRCVTQVPCGEPTGFTGRCTKQPDVGGAWPCITAIPHCSEPTGFTGQCTYQPWPNPTRYIGCTFLHCPTQDLTHIPHICNIVATGVPGCPVVDPRGGGIDPAAGAGEEGGAAAERLAAPVTSIPGCGYTKQWGLCPTLPPKCIVSVDIPCITRDQACAVTRNPACLANAAGGGFAAFRDAGPGPAIPVNTAVIQCNPSAVDACPTQKGCQTLPPTAMTSCTQFGPPCPTPATICTQSGPQCPTSCGPECQTQQPGCTQVACTQVGTQCPTQGGAVCPTHFSPCTITPQACFQPVQAAGAQELRAAGPIGPTGFQGCTQTNNCLTIPNGDCTFFGCPPGTHLGTQCPTHGQPHCTCGGPACPPTPATICTQSGPQCPTQFGSGCPTDFKLDCTFGCTQVGPSCPATNLQANCGANVEAVGAQAFAAGPAGLIGPTGFRGCTIAACPHPTIWTLIGPRCFTVPSGDCTFFGCPPTPGIVCTQLGPQCPTRHLICAKEPTPATICFICTQVPQLCGRAF